MNMPVLCTFVEDTTSGIWSSPESGPLLARKLDLHQQFSVSFTINEYPDRTPLEKPDFLAIWLCNFFFVSRIVKLPGQCVMLFAASFLSIFFLSFC